MRRLYLQIYLTVIAGLVLSAVLVSLAWWLAPASEQDRLALEGIGALAGDILPAPDRPVAELERALQGLADHLPLQLAVFSPSGVRLASVGEPLAAPRPGRTESGWVRSRGAGPTWAIRLPDGRWLVVRHPHGGPGPGFIGVLALVAVALAIAAYPLVRRITGRLERLREGVENLGAGNLSARVRVEGHDEVAGLAASFNQAAGRIEALLQSRKDLLANASHELRSPLARIRMGVETLAHGHLPGLSKQLVRDIAELDGLIDELLVASRLDVLERPEKLEEVDLLGLLAEECARVGAEPAGQPVIVRGDPRLLRRMLRNLLENANRHGRGAARRSVRT